MMLPKAQDVPHWMRTVLTTLLGVLILTAVVAVLAAYGSLLGKLLQGDLKKDDIQSLLLVLAGLLGAPFVVWRAVIAQGNLDRSKDRDYASESKFGHWVPLR